MRMARFFMQAFLRSQAQPAQQTAAPPRGKNLDSMKREGLDLPCKYKMADGLKRFTDQRTNPCMAESKASMKCLDENYYDKSKCRMYFEAYKECKKAWNERKAARRRQGLPPNDPAPV